MSAQQQHNKGILGSVFAVRYVQRLCQEMQNTANKIQDK